MNVYRISFELFADVNDKMSFPGYSNSKWLDPPFVVTAGDESLAVLAATAKLTREQADMIVPGSTPRVEGWRVLRLPSDDRRLWDEVER